jgi:glycosyltransferase involved in cell wall biosynthesis
VVAFPAGALPEIIEHGLTGFLVSSVEEMAEAIRKVDRLKSEDCRAAAVQRFSAHTMAAQYLKLYEQIVCGRVPRREVGVMQPGAAA